MDSLTYFFDVFKSEFEDALPEIDENSYDKLIETYDSNYKGYDSLVGVYEKINEPFGKNKVLTTLWIWGAIRLRTSLKAPTRLKIRS